MSEMMERVARAVATRNRGSDLWEEIADEGDTDYIGKNDYRDMARAAIEAMQVELGEYARGFPLEDVRRPTLEAWWHRIDEALK